ncbi:MAG: hypothetical protein PHP85_12850 [Gallionella sp.]|nr:hypothetical protein [Gallionella sp.]
MKQWPEDEALSRLYREMPGEEADPKLKARVMAVAHEHAAAILHARSARSASVFSVRRWYVPTALAASVATLAWMLLQSPVDVAPVRVAMQDVPAVKPEKPPHETRMAEVEPARPDAGEPVTGGAVQPHDVDLWQTQADAPPQDESGKGILADKPAAVWLNEIRALQRQGKLPEAKEQLRQFRQKHPDEPLPEDLKILALRGLSR